MPEPRNTIDASAFCGKLFGGIRPMEAGGQWKMGFWRRIYPGALAVFDVVLILSIFVGMRGLEGVGKQIACILTVFSVFGLYLIGSYNYRTHTNSARFVSEHVLVSIFTGLLIFASILFIAKGFPQGTDIVPRKTMYAVLFTLVLFPACSIAYRFQLQRVKSRRQKKRAICIVGATDQSFELIETIRLNRFPQEIIVFDDSDKRPSKETLRSHGAKWKPLASFEPEYEIVDGKHLEHIILAKNPEELSPDLVKRLIQGHSIYNHVVTLDSFVLKEFKYVPTHLVTPSWAFGEGFRINSSLAYNRAKRIFDFIISSVGLVIAAPPMLLIAFLVKLTSPGRVVYTQERIGHHERPFKLYKFRTMVEGADRNGDYTAKRDIRVTPIGRFLRKTRLDELPQLVNVLKGDMSLIGPRPEWSRLVERYESRVALYHYRHLVRPGITGWAQVNYAYGASMEDAIEKLKYDLYYVRYYSLVQDMTIIVKTAYMMLFGRGR